MPQVQCAACRTFYVWIFLFTAPLPALPNWWIDKFQHDIDAFLNFRYLKKVWCIIPIHMRLSALLPRKRSFGGTSSASCTTAKVKSVHVKAGCVVQEVKLGTKGPSLAALKKAGIYVQNMSCFLP